MWVRAAFFGDRRSERWLQDGGHLTRVMVESINVKGGATVPEELSSAVIALREEFGIARQFCQIMGMNSDTLVVPRRTGGVTAVYVGEEDAITASDAAWDNVTLNTRKLAALTRVSNDLIEDAVIDLATWLADEMARAFAEAEDDALWNGDGTSTYGGIVGVRPKLVDGTHTVGAVDATSGDDTFAEIIAGDLDTLMGTLPNYARKGAAWYCSQVCNQLVFQSIARAAGGVTMIETGGVIIPSYAGYPIRISEKMPTSTGSLDAVAMVLFGNLEMSAMLGDRRGFNVKVLEERYAEFDQVGVRATERYDIVVHDLGDTSAAGPIVGLIGNA
jgi:HK97 family phage major capsid protein